MKISLGPILFSMQDRGCWKIGPRFSQAWHAGKKWKET